MDPRTITEIKVNLEEWNDDDKVYCIVDDDNPDWTLCGIYCPDEPEMPDCEVPLEVTCEECLAIERARQSP